MGDVERAETAKQIAFLAFQFGRRLTKLIHNISEETTAEGGDLVRMRELMREVADGRLTFFDPVEAIGAQDFTPEKRARVFELVGGLQARECDTAVLILRALEDMEEL
jgi:hypothetical protein